MNPAPNRVDAISLEVLRNAISAIADEMNANLVRTAYSPNIKERRDCSSAVFDAHGQMVAQAESIPVHLGAMPYSVQAAIRHVKAFAPGDVVVLNDPYAGGAHLPDITFVAPVFMDDRLIAFVANRAHHADVGGKEPGSLAGDTVEIYQEGLRIPPIRLWEEGTLHEDLLQLILANVRTPDERWGDLRAQKAGCAIGIERLRALCLREGEAVLADAMAAVLDYSERRMRHQIAQLPDGEASFEDALDNDGISDDRIPICVHVKIQGDRIGVDFRGTAKQVRGPVNAVLAVTASATYFAIRAFADPDIPPNSGCFRPIEITAAEGSVVNACLPAPVVGGNLETSQRIVDVILGALGKLVPEQSMAACQGSMNNLAIGGLDPRTEKPFTLYETMAGGFGGRRTKDGIDGIHSHMTNTLNTPVEALETSYPLRVERYELRPGTGGEGQFRGGLGIRRDMTCLAESARVSFLTDRRLTRPYGVEGGEPGALGRNVLIRGGQEVDLPSKGTATLHQGDTISIQTPGGGGFGLRSARSQASIERDQREGRI
ncbi:MAG: hydantoinase B/oxoprolinase family protein [Candidatus Atribacteria bacterium]|nr:MAG: hydantoinase B/oxoprolinase family protein [Candidatus Atribacteria bacterium]